ncbi:accessory gene regulator B family protein [Paenibacillus sp. 19GGS1-52]|uniref:accessory gene regulator ArgB-like protein n=1 Tax=Paenibacillus sp. 19GGS1-52 TaxID=2758563 RepID=UPI001EFA9DB0|nr:accessory gene regulator B family protein [Paenibacillus sp. 19GGS1-52]ULO09165.1 accessory gene regulator B family protein [Paenibacillus sp. 19GGS1-52]
METLAYKIARTIKSINPEETHSIEIMKYSLTIILNTLTTFIISVLLGWLSGELEATIIVFFCLSLLRMLSGGVHFRTARACNIFSILLCTVIPHLSGYTLNYIWIINSLSLAIMFLFAPNPDYNSQIPLRLYPLLKILSLLLVSSNFLIVSSTIGLSFLVQSWTIIPKGRRINHEKGIR